MVRADANILVVDDEEAVLHSFGNALSGAGYRTILSGDGESALRQAAESAFDVAILDLEMSGSDPLSVLDGIRGSQPWIEVIVVADRPTIERVKEALKSGASEFLPKPARPSSILRVVAEAVERRGWRLRRDPDEAGGPGPLPSPGGVWMVYGGRGRVTAGLDPLFLEAGEEPAFLELPLEGAGIEREQTLLRVLCRGGRIVELASPVAGRVRRTNDAVADGAAGFGAWAVQMDVADRSGKE